MGANENVKDKQMAGIRTLLGLVSIMLVLYGVETLAQNQACDNFMAFSLSWLKAGCW